MKIKGTQSRAVTGVKKFNDEDRTVEIVWTTGSRELRQSYDGPYIEELEVSKRAVDLKRLNAGAPYLNAHSGYDALKVHGSVVKGSASIDEARGEGIATIRFDDPANDPEAGIIYNKIKNEIITGNSVGYRVLKAQVTGEKVDGVPVVRITKWEPLEISCVPIAVDIGAKFRAVEGDGDIETEQEGTKMTPEELAALAAKEKEEADKARAVALEASHKRSVEEALVAERARVVEIRSICQIGKVDEQSLNDLISRGATPDDARKSVFELMAKRNAAAVGEPLTAKPAVLGEDLAAIRFRGMSEAIAHRVAPGKNPLTDAAKDYRGRSMIELASACLEEQGISTRGKTKMEIAKMALQTRGHSTADFPLLLADTGNKTLRDGYTEAPQTFEPFIKRTKAPDFKDLKRTALGAFPGLVAKAEGAPYQGSTMSEAREVYHVETFGRKIQFTREALVNDDLDAFSSILPRMGAAAKRKEADNVYAIFTANAAMSDTVALFHATHANLGSGVPSAASIGAAFLAMRKQTGLASELLDLAPKVMLVPGALEFLALQLKATLPGLGVSTNSNPYAGRYDVVVEPRLDATSALVWYMTADKSQIDMIEFATLEGQDAPVMESETDFDTDGLTMKIRWEFGVKAIDWRGLYKSTGA